MPLLDRFHSPLSRTHPWRGFHGAWAAAMARLLNGGILPAGYYAVPFLDRDGPIEIDVANLRPFDATMPTSDGLGVQQWTPPAHSMAVAVEWPSVDDVHVEVLTDDGDLRLAAAIELVSPRNKDRKAARDAFAAKFADHLRRGCGLVVVDVVTTRRADLQAELFAALGVSLAGEIDRALSAAFYRSIGRDANGQLLIWDSTIDVGSPLPTVPLWLGAELAVPLDLETSHTTACEDLRIREAG